MKELQSKDKFLKVRVRLIPMSFFSFRIHIFFIQEIYMEELRNDEGWRKGGERNEDQSSNN